MKIALEYKDSNSRYTKVSWFIDNKYVGQLRIATADVAHLQLVIDYGLNMPNDNFSSRGYVYQIPTIEN